MQGVWLESGYSQPTPDQPSPPARDCSAQGDVSGALDAGVVNVSIDRAGMWSDRSFCHAARVVWWKVLGDAM
jgi:hypothetical protein